MENKAMRRKIIWAMVLGYVALNLIGVLAYKHQSVFLRIGDSSGKTDLHWAAWDGRTSAVKKLLEKGANVNCRDDDGETPLHYAAFKGHRKTAELLIANGANINAREYLFKTTPLHYAATCARVEIVKILLASGADINARNSEGWTPLEDVEIVMEDAPMPYRFLWRKKYKACAELLRDHENKRKE